MTKSSYSSSGVAMLRDGDRVRALNDPRLREPRLLLPGLDVRVSTPPSSPRGDFGLWPSGLGNNVWRSSLADSLLATGCGDLGDRTWMTSSE